MLLLKLNIGCERFYLCRLFTIDWSKPEMVTGQYKSCANPNNPVVILRFAILTPERLSR